MPVNEELIPAMNRIVKAIKRYDTWQLFLSLRGVPPLIPQVEEWMQTTLVPRLRQSGVGRLAVLLPTEGHNLRVLEGMLWNSTTSVLPYELQYFPDLPAALDWVTNAELPTTERNWTRSWRRPALLRFRRRRWSRHPPAR